MHDVMQDGMQRDNQSGYFLFGYINDSKYSYVFNDLIFFIEKSYDVLPNFTAADCTYNYLNVVSYLIEIQVSACWVSAEINISTS